MPRVWTVFPETEGLRVLAAACPGVDGRRKRLPPSSARADASVPSANDGHPLLRSQREAAPGPRQRDRHHGRAGLPHLPGESARARPLSPPACDARPPRAADRPPPHSW